MAPADSPASTPAGADQDAVIKKQPLSIATPRGAVDTTQDAVHAADTPRARAARRRTTGVANLAYVVEKADEAILPASFSFVGAAWNAAPGTLGDITFVRGLVQALATPLSGILGDRLDRTYVIAGGALLWGVMTIAMGLANTAGQAMVFAAFNGLGLALIIPCIQSLIADYYPAGARGRAFGALFLTSSLGQVAGGFFATAIGGKTVAGTAGWRFAFFLVGGISIAAAVLALALARDPRPRRGWAKRTAPGLAGSLAWARDAAASAGRDIATVFRIPTFAIIVSQGIVGMMPWVALGFLTAYLQLLGFADLSAALIVAAFNLGTAFGNLISGFIGDAAVKRFPNAGRIATAHVSVLLSFPTAAVLLRGLPRGPPPSAYAAAAAAGAPVPTPLGSAADAGLYAAAFFIGGLLISWCSTTNSAVFSEVVPSHLRSSIYAFDRSFENAVGNTAGPIVGRLASGVFGFKGALTAGAGLPPALRAANASALNSSLLVMTLAPWAACFTAYCFLYYFFPRDRARARGGGVGGEGVMDGDSTGGSGDGSAGGVAAVVGGPAAVAPVDGGTAKAGA